MTIEQVIWKSTVALTAIPFHRQTSTTPQTPTRIFPVEQQFRTFWQGAIGVRCQQKPEDCRCKRKTTIARIWRDRNH